MVKMRKLRFIKKAEIKTQKQNYLFKNLLVFSLILFINFNFFGQCVPNSKEFPERFIVI